MKAVVITRPGGPEVLEIQERPVPEPGPEEILVRVSASALNRADLLQRRGRYPAPPGTPPEVPGLEYAGEVVARGNQSGLLEVGARVMGIIGGGGHAEFVRVDEREAIAIPENLTDPEAAAVPEAFVTAYDALVRQARIGPGDRLLVHAVASGVGSAALQLGVLNGATVVGTSRSRDKLEALEPLGLAAGVDTADPGWAEALEAHSAGGGYDVILDVLGGPYTAENVKLLAPGGRLIVLGTLSGSRTELDLRVLMTKRATVRGSVLRARPLEEKIELAREVTDALVPHLRSGRLRPIVDRVFTFAEIVVAHERMEANLNRGKIVLVW